MTAFTENVIYPNDEESNPSHLAASFTAEYNSKYIFAALVHCSAAAAPYVSMTYDLQYNSGRFGLE